jgi:homoserine O-acetyltransferase
MKLVKAAAAFAMTFAMTFATAQVSAADYPTPQQGEWIARDFKFHTGEVMKELKLHYTTIGDPKGKPVLVLHGTGGSAQSMLGAGFAGALFGPGQPLDATKYYIIIPDAIGAGQSSKPSDGLRAKFPKYNYDDMVTAQHLLIKDGLGIQHLRLVIGNSMGGMQTWMWAAKYPTYMDAAVPMASQPTPMASRNWMMRRMLLEAIKADPAFKNGDYTEQPPMLRIANVFFSIGTNGGSLRYQKIAATNAAADAFVDKALAAPMKADANDFLYQWSSSQDYDVSKDLDKIEAQVLVINSADDERNPPETGILDQAMKRVKNGRVYLIPASADTGGHGTTGGMARLYAEPLAELLATAPQRGM